ncbi:hypothetical protein [Pseudomonas sp. PvP001]|uniref:hypothetical protein n=1 Tax=Pseudomonas sp. PvP001 TaxID=3158559 RepID=UPI003398F29D
MHLTCIAAVRTDPIAAYLPGSLGLVIALRIIDQGQPLPFLIIDLARQSAGVDVCFEASLQRRRMKPG